MSLACELKGCGLADTWKRAQRPTTWDGKRAYLVKVPPSLVEVESSGVLGDCGQVVCDEHGGEYRNIDKHQQDSCGYRVESEDGP